MGQNTTGDYKITIERRRKANRGYERENELTEQSQDGYRGNDTHKGIFTVDVVHSVSLLACVISDREE